MDRRTYRINKMFHFLGKIMLATDIISIVAVIILLILGVGSVIEWVVWLFSLLSCIPSTIRLLQKTKPSDNDQQ